MPRFVAVKTERRKNVEWNTFCLQPKTLNKMTLDCGISLFWQASLYETPSLNVLELIAHDYLTNLYAYEQSLIRKHKVDSPNKSRV